MNLPASKSCHTLRHDPFGLLHMGLRLTEKTKCKHWPAAPPERKSVVPLYAVLESLLCRTTPRSRSHGLATNYHCPLNQPESLPPSRMPAQCHLTSQLVLPGLPIAFPQPSGDSATLWRYVSEHITSSIGQFLGRDGRTADICRISCCRPGSYFLQTHYFLPSVASTTVSKPYPGKVHYLSQGEPGCPCGPPTHRVYW
jgi:hypothetical protein